MNSNIQKNFSVTVKRSAIDSVIQSATFSEHVVSISYDLARKRITIGVVDDTRGYVTRFITEISRTSTPSNILARPDLVVSSVQASGYTLKFTKIALKAHSLDRGDKTEFSLADFGIETTGLDCVHKVTFTYADVKVIHPVDQPSEG